MVRRLRLVVGGPGTFDFDWDGTDGSGHTVAGGVYFLQLETSYGRDATRVTLLK